jgi:hypothetical protein
MASLKLQQIVQHDEQPKTIVSTARLGFATTISGAKCNHLLIDETMSTAFYLQTAGQTEQKSATGLGNSQVDLLWTLYTDQLRSQPFKQPNPLQLSTANPLHTHQTAGVADIGMICQFQSPVRGSGFFHVWSHSDILLLIAKDLLW